MSKKNILVAEDDKFLSKVVVGKLKRQGYQVELASDGGEAIEKIRGGNIDLVLLDLVMPEKDGFEVLEDVKSDDNYKDLTFLVFSNLGQDSDVKRAKELGAVDYFVKSNLSINEVLEKVKEHI